MVTSLAAQLAALRPSATQTVQSDAGGLKQRPSLLFSPSEAADLDSEAIQSIGLSGLAELEKHDPALRKYEKLLLARTSAEFRREIQSSEVLRSLNQSIRGLLKALTPYFLLRPSLKVLEFLIRTYNVQEHNVDDLLMCALPYHSTPQFVRLVHLIEPKGCWSFLNGVKKTGAPLSRTVLASRCAADRAVLTFICDLAKEPLATRVSLNLFVSTCIEIFNTSRKVPEGTTLAILPVLLEGLRASSSNDLQASAYMVLAALVKRVTLSAEVLKTVVSIIPTYANRDAPLPSLLVLASVCHHQRPDSLSDAALQSIVRLQDLASLLAKVAAVVDSSHLISLLAPALVRSAAVDQKSLADLRALLANVELDKSLVHLIARTLTRTCRIFHSQKERALSSSREHPGVQQLGQVLCDLGNCYPEMMDDFIGAQLCGRVGVQARDKQIEGSSDSESDEVGSSDEDEGAANKRKSAQEEWLLPFLSKTFHGTRHCPVPEGGTTLLLAMEHPAQAVRLAAVSRISEMVDTDVPPPYLAEALLRRIEHDDAAVAFEVLSFDKLVAVVPADALFRVLSSAADGLCGKRTSPGESAAVQEQALKVLASPFLDRYPNLADRVATVLMRHMLVYAKTRRRNTLALKLAAEVPIPTFMGLREIWGQWKAARSAAADAGVRRGGKEKKSKYRTPEKDQDDLGKAVERVKGEGLWDLNIRVVAAVSNNVVRAGKDARAGMLMLLAESRAHLLQALVLAATMDKVKGTDTLEVVEELFHLLEAHSCVTHGEPDQALTMDHRSEALDDEMEEELEITAPWLDKLFPTEVVTDPAWYRLQMLLSARMLLHLRIVTVDLDPAGQLPVHACPKSFLQVGLLRRVFAFFTCRVSIAACTGHIQRLVGCLGADMALPFLSWFVRDAQRANEYTRAHALYISASMLRGQTSGPATRIHVLGRVALTLPSVLAALQAEEASVRHAALTWLRAAAAVGMEDGTSKIKFWGKETIAELVPVSDLVQFLAVLVSCCDDFVNDAAFLPVFFERALSFEVIGTERVGDGDGAALVSALPVESKEKLQALLLRQTLALGADDMAAQVVLCSVVALLEGLHRVARPKLVLPLAQGLLASLAAITMSPSDDCPSHAAGTSGATQPTDQAAAKALLLRLVRVTVQLSYGHGIDVAIDTAGKRASKLMSPLLDSLHKEAVEASACQVSARDTGRKEGKDGGKGKDRRSRGMWLELMIKCLTPSLLDVMDAPAKLQLFDDLYVISRQSQRPNVCKAARDSLRKLPLDIGQLDSRLATLCKELQAANATQHRAGKRTKPGLAEASCAEVYPVASVAAAVVVLDSLQAHVDPAHALDLMPRLFDVLAAINESSPATLDAEDGDESLAQSVLGVILALLQAAATRNAVGGVGGKKLNSGWHETTERGVDIAALVSTIRLAVSPQTRHEALKCLIQLAQCQPHKVLKHVMKVFMFLGENDMDDHHVFHIIEHTIKSIVPPLVEHGMRPMALLRVFINALPSIPVHRRLRLFSTLLMLVDSDETLQIFLTLLLAAPPSCSHESELVGFGVTVCAQFMLDKQLNTTLLVLETLASMPAASNMLKACENTAYAAAGDSMDTLQRLQLRLLHVINGILSGRPFESQMKALPVAEEAEAQEKLLTLFERVLALQQRIGQDLQDSTTDLPSAATDRSLVAAPLASQLAQRLDEMLYLIGRHLSVRGFVRTIGALLARQESYVQQRALQCLVHKLQLLDSGVSPDLQTLLLSLMPLLDRLVRSGESSTGAAKAAGKEKCMLADHAKRAPLVAQLSLCVMEHLARLFGANPSNQEALDSAVGAVVLSLEHESAAVTTSACSCVAAMVCHSSTMMVDHVNNLVPGLIGVLQRALASAHRSAASARRWDGKLQAQQELEDDATLRAHGAILAMDRVVSKIPMLVTPQVGKILGLLLHPSLLGTKSSCDLNSAAQNMRHTLVTRVAPRVMMPALERACNDALGWVAGSCVVESSVVALMELVEYLCGRMGNKDVSLYYMQLFRLLLEALDVRYQALSPALSPVSSMAEGGRERGLARAHAVEASVLKVFEALVLKLNENRFKPVFLKMIDWSGVREDFTATMMADGGRERSVEESERQLRIMCRFVILCRVLNVLGRRLKAIMVPYFSYVMDFLLTILKSRRALFYALPRLFAVAEDARPTKGKSSKKRRRLSESDLAATDPTAALGDECVEWAVAAVHQCVLYDSLGFMTKERFEALYVPLVDLLADAYEDTARFHARVDTYLKPAIVQLAVAVQGSTGSTILWKPLNYHLLMHTRHDSPSVRFAALTVAQALVERLGEEYLTLVPETLPFVVEVLEDMDEQVESAARSLVAALECLLGESLNEYLTQ